MYICIGLVLNLPPENKPWNVVCNIFSELTLKASLLFFPKGSETYESLLPQVKGTFGGRFTTTINKDSYRFEYIAYTD